MIHPDEEEHLAEAYFTYVNDVIGLFAIALAATSLQFEQPAPFARLFLIIITLHIVSKQKMFRIYAARYFSRHKGLWGSLYLMWKQKIYVFAFVSLALIALGEITKHDIYRWLSL
ncbi:MULTISPECIES: hypothetical protein [Vibrio]|uniref:Uncharacterized protein n=1 Tax=Vibrio proteolyticus NBRC 13287 TaxID=1219065 RepID=U3A759_VIBPR|nr:MULTISPECIES: hypothetical protein [Vibrio]NAW59739.1 hypothetical protein [Vibrio sp. V36_P2S2PM302]NAX24763.1 hypothetical protein [Vibrio sp. V38_P2S17PM301]NAX29532.1 hypothetical protein [Vibrio sp. V37_P2S8PM304]GAD67425.1 hypothetical protein VPR01S_08_00090 [Vibrio proteolyticus NBRC 13287]GAD69535.1 hypothetical protein VPR01S_35_00060 [Vibrio proteolyticus NBRC 13287]